MKIAVIGAGPRATGICQLLTAGGYDVTRAGDQLAAQGLAAEPEPGAVCCYARQDKAWVHDPDGVAWEYYTVLEHLETP